MLKEICDGKYYKNRKASGAWSHSAGYCVEVDTSLAEALLAISGKERLLSCFLSSIFLFKHSRRRPAFFSHEHDTIVAHQGNRKPKGS